MKPFILINALWFAMPLAAQLPAEKPVEIILANQVVLRIRVAAGGLSAEERAIMINKRLVEALSYEAPSPEQVQIIKEKGLTAIYIGKTLIVTVTEADAKANANSTVDALAQAWANNLKRAFVDAVPYRRIVYEEAAGIIAPKP